MRIWILALVAIGGCAAETPTAVDAKSSPDSALPTSTPEVPATSASEASAVVEGQNPNRINQLADLKRVKVVLPKKTVDAWVMDNNSKRQEGMMFLTAPEVKDTDGMLFVFPTEAPRGFWMQNTILGLDIIYIAKDGTVVSIAKGKPKDETSLPSEGPAMYVLELKAGKAAEFGVRKGIKLKLPPVKALE